ncbi:cytochrome c biogenesis heme-transporting ATPase CcmA [Gallaecimonas sp. GXIMD4217]|uniref:cytochrome c biogenesis heme-transporting ATPase CcmA n=1 Tax=Gallaecimonas sp. GXIMD4217 TaxID=3131927 RepID=UPI00311AEED9
MLAAQDLCCIREERVLFEGLDLHLHPGELVQLEGPNGAGKTSLLRILAGLSQAEEGQVFYLGEPIHKAREAYHQDLLFLGHQSGVNQTMTALENLAFYARVLPSRDQDLWAILARVGLAGFEDVPVGQLSAGQQRRVALARLWLSPARIWILDEPFTAIDKQGVAELELLFAVHCEGGGVVLLTTHQDLGSANARRLSLLGETP